MRDQPKCGECLDSHVPLACPSCSERHVSVVRSTYGEPSSTQPGLAELECNPCGLLFWLTPEQLHALIENNGLEPLRGEHLVHPSNL